MLDRLFFILSVLFSLGDGLTAAVGGDPPTAPPTLAAPLPAGAPPTVPEAEALVAVEGVKWSVDPENEVDGGRVDPESSGISS